MTTKTTAGRKAPSDVDTHLRRAFQELASEPLPDRFSALLQQLREEKPTSEGETSRKAASSRSGENA